MNNTNKWKIGLVLVSVLLFLYKVRLVFVVASAFYMSLFSYGGRPQLGGISGEPNVQPNAFSIDSLYGLNQPQTLPATVQKQKKTALLPLILPDDSFFSRQWYISNPGNFNKMTARAGADIGLLQAWQIQQGDSNIIVAVLDGGLDFENPEFAGRIWKNHKEIPGNLIDDDGNGFIDDTEGWDFVNNDNFPEDEEGHGTNVAGIIGANGNNKIGYAGIDLKCKLLICKITDASGSGKYTHWAEAIRYAVDNGARIINMSVGGTSKSAALQDAVDYAYQHNVLVVSAMMNTNTDKPYYPAACTNVLAVGATNPDDSRANPFFWNGESGSNYGDHISVVAPGNYIYGLSLDGYNTFWGGTSQATPIVSGIAALLLAENPALTPDEIKAAINLTADDLIGNDEEDVAGWDQYYGYGRVNAYKALQYVNLLQSAENIARK